MFHYPTTYYVKSNIFHIPPGARFIVELFEFGRERREELRLVMPWRRGWEAAGQTTGIVEGLGPGPDPVDAFTGFF